MFSTQAVVIIWGDGVANYIVMVIIAQCTSNRHVVHPKPAQRYVSIMSQYSQRHKAGESPPLLRTHPLFSALNHVLTERRLSYIYFTNKPKILLGVLWKGHFPGSTLRASDSWCEWTQNILIQSGWGPWIFSDPEYTALRQVLLCSLILDHHAGRIMWLRTVIASSSMESVEALCKVLSYK